MGNRQSCTVRNAADPPSLPPPTVFSPNVQEEGMGYFYGRAQGASRETKGEIVTCDTFSLKWKRRGEERKEHTQRGFPAKKES